MKTLKFKNLSVYKTLSTLSLIGVNLGLMVQTGVAMVRPLAISNSPTTNTKFFYGSGGAKIPINTSTTTTYNKTSAQSTLPTTTKNESTKYFYRNGARVPIFETKKITSSPIKNESLIGNKNDDIKSSTYNPQPLSPNITYIKIVSSKYKKPTENSEVTLEKVYVDLNSIKKQTHVNDEISSNLPPVTLGPEKPEEDLFIAVRVPVIPVSNTYLPRYRSKLQTIPE